MVAIGTPLTHGHRLPASPLVAVAVAFAVCCGLWWVYFQHTADTIGPALETAPDQTDIIRTVLSYGHLLLIAGIITIAVGLRETVADPGARLSWGVAGLLFGGCALYLATIGYTRWRMDQQVAPPAWHRRRRAAAAPTGRTANPRASRHDRPGRRARHPEPPRGQANPTIPRPGTTRHASVEVGSEVVRALMICWSLERLGQRHQRLSCVPCSCQCGYLDDGGPAPGIRLSEAHLSSGSRSSRALQKTAPTANGAHASEQARNSRNDGCGTPASPRRAEARSRLREAAFAGGLLVCRW